MKYFSMFTGVGGFELGIEKAFYNTKSTNEESKSSEPQETTGGKRTVTVGQNRIYGEYEPAPLCYGENIGSYGNAREAPFIYKNKSNNNNTKRRGTPTICVGFSEIDKYASQVLKYRFPGVKNYGNAKEINPDELPDFDLLVGGFPCQAFSIAGKRRGFEDTRGTLFFDIARVLRSKRPRHILLENVKGLLNHQKGETFRVILQTLQELGYYVEWGVCNSRYFGVPQNRERVFIVGSLGGERRQKVFPFVNRREEDNASLEEGDVARCVTTAHAHSSSTNMSYVRAVLTPNRFEKRQNGRRMKDNEEPSFTLTKQDQHGVYDGYKIRRLTPLECERLQGFPDDWTQYGIDDTGNQKEMSDTQRYKMMGNAVTTNVVEAIITQMEIL